MCDPVSKGRAYLRAHNYYRTAEFFLPPDDDKRPECFRKSVATFRLGLQWLGVKHDLIDVPYGEHTLKAIYYPGPPGAEAKPLIVAGGGFDSTQEELYFLIVAAAHERDYAVLTYAGPGQGAVLREQGLKFTHEWEKPVGAVLDTFLERYPRPPKIILVGASMGGYLAPRAAAFEERIDGVVALGVFFDWQEIALHMRKAPDSPGFRWALANSEWTLGVRGEMEVYIIFGRYNLKDTAQHITCDVLILHGENDHYVPLK